jgi:hypothetical protein
MFHELGPHLGHTHLVQEVAIITTHRELPPLHPVHALIIDHSRKTIAINEGARDVLVPKIFKYLGVVCTHCALSCMLLCLASLRSPFSR